jgi:hypothetical protein
MPQRQACPTQVRTHLFSDFPGLFLVNRFGGRQGNIETVSVMKFACEAWESLRQEARRSSPILQNACYPLSVSAR